MRVWLLFLCTAVFGGGLLDILNQGLQRNAPGLINRIYPDGREVPVCGLHFRRLNTRLLREIIAASDDGCVLNYLDALVTFALTGASSFAALASAFASAIEFDVLALVPAREESRRVPVVSLLSVRADRR